MKDVVSVFRAWSLDGALLLLVDLGDPRRMGRPRRSLTDAALPVG